MSVRDVKAAVPAIIADNTVEAQELETLLASPGGKVSADEFKVIKDTLQTKGLKMDAATRKQAREFIRSMEGFYDEKEEANATVAADAPGLAQAFTDRFAVGSTEATYAGTAIPEAVSNLIRTAQAAGAKGYDVRELDDPGKDAHGEWAAQGVWSPYPQECEEGDTMAFTHTEITPKKISDDMSTVQTYWQKTGTENVTLNDGSENEEGTYEEITGKGTGNITEEYDEASHSRRYARGMAGQIWSSNFGILDDGSLHAVPAMRRTNTAPGLILTNPSLARGHLMLCNGHLTMEAGVVTRIGISGRLENRAEEEAIKMIDPKAILAAWGFEISADCQVVWEGSNQVATTDPTTNLLAKPSK